MAKSKKVLSADLAAAFAADSGVGFEEVTSSDLQIPFLRIIQALSPQLKKNDPAYIEGAGQLCPECYNEIYQKIESPIKD